MANLNPVLCTDLTVGNSRIVHGFFTRQGGVSEGIYQSLNSGPSSGDDSGNVRKNRRAIVRYLGLGDDDLVTPWQHHSSDVLVATGNWGNVRPKADAIVSNTPDLPIAVLTADCGPVLFCDSQNEVIGAAHAGWRGATLGVLESAVEKMLELGAKRDNIRATLGPTISGENYEVGPEFVENLTELDSDNHRYLAPSTRHNHAYFDLPGYIVGRLVKFGVNARWTGQCTYGDEARFFSYRRKTHRGETDYGCQISAIAIKNK
jgi:YfiH family protein